MKVDPDDVLKVVLRLEAIDDRFFTLEMTSECVRSSGCGTIACHAGAYLLACKGKEAIGTLRYYDGAKLMAKHLGFQNPEQLEEWADENPYIWGNTCGGVMFGGNGKAFDRTYPTLRNVCDHWRGVAERLKEQQND